jgi:hypothetical protein
MLTAWDGYARVDYLVSPRRVQVTLMTAEPTIYRRVRTGLGCAFATDDSTGPPTFVEVDISAELSDDDRVLLGAPLSSVVNSLVGTEPGSRHTRLALDEIANLADTWAPYRAEVLDAPEEAKSGTWTEGLWTWLKELGLLNALTVAVAPEFRSTGPDAFDDWYQVRLPRDLASAAGVNEMLRWYVLSDPDPRFRTSVLVLVIAEPGTVPNLLASIDDGTGTWVPFEMEPAVENAFTAELPFDPERGEPALRFRTGRRADG